MKLSGKILVILVILISGFGLKAQNQDSTSSSYIPKESHGKKLYIVKFDVLTPREVYTHLNSPGHSGYSGNERICDNAEIYNIVLYRKLNNLIDELLENELDNNLVVLHERDILEDSNARFLIYPVVDKFSFLEDNFMDAFYIYDRKTNISYQKTNMNTLLMLRREFYWEFKKQETDEYSQAEVDNFLLKLFPKPKSPIPNAVKITFGVICYAIFQVGIIALNNL